MTDKPKYLIESMICVKKQELADTDYKAIKFAEGALSAEEYEPDKLAREQLRKEINELETELAEFPDEETV